MPKFMAVSTALRRVVEDDAAPALDRWKALRQLEHPPLCMLRRLLVKSAKRVVPVPSKLYALAALVYAREVELRRGKKKWRAVTRVPRRVREDDAPADTTGNALGI